MLQLVCLTISLEAAIESRVLGVFGKRVWTLVHFGAVRRIPCDWGITPVNRDATPANSDDHIGGLCHIPVKLGAASQNGKDNFETFIGYLHLWNKCCAIVTMGSNSVLSELLYGTVMGSVFSRGADTGSLNENSVQAI